jgi:hypothetical protein
MAKQGNVDKQRLTLQKYIDNKSFVKFFRTICGQEENLTGFILAMSEDFLLLQLGTDFMLHEYAIIKIGDYDSIRHSSYERTFKRIIKAEGIFATHYGFDKPLPLTSWNDILKTLKEYDTDVIIKNFRKDYLDFWIGSIKRVSDKSVSIHNYDPDGVLDSKPSLIQLDTINILTFGSRYLTIFKKYLRSK